MVTSMNHLELCFSWLIQYYPILKHFGVICLCFAFTLSTHAWQTPTTWQLCAGADPVTLQWLVGRWPLDWKAPRAYQGLSAYLPTLLYIYISLGNVCYRAKLQVATARGVSRCRIWQLTWIRIATSPRDPGAETAVGHTWLVTTGPFESTLFLFYHRLLQDQIQFARRRWCITVSRAPLPGETRGARRRGSRDPAGQRADPKTTFEAVQSLRSQKETLYAGNKFVFILKNWNEIYKPDWKQNNIHYSD